MIFRSSNTHFTHFGGDLVSNVESSHGVQLTGGSTGAIVQPAGDDNNILLTIRGKGTGAVQIGNSSSPAIIGGSTRTFKGIYYQESTYSHAAISAARSLELTFASTTTDVEPGDLVSIGLVVATANLSSAVNVASHRLSTAATSRLTIVLSNVQSTATSTGSGTLQLSWLDLT